MNKAFWREGDASCPLGLLALAMAVLSACAAEMPAKRTTHGTLDLAHALPAPTQSPFGLSSGHGVRDSRLPLGNTAAIDAYIKPEAARAIASAATPRPWTAPRTRSLTAAVAPSLEVPHAVAIAASAGAPAVRGAESASVVAQPSSVLSDTQRYAQRQNQSKKLEGYRAGDVVVISVSTLLIVLLVVLLLVLLL